MTAPEPSLPPDLEDLRHQLDAAERDAGLLVAGLTEPQGQWSPQPGRWSVAQCLDHLATANRVYLRAMSGPAAGARSRGRLRSGPARPGWGGGMFVRLLEPPPKRWVPMPAPAIIRPRRGPPLHQAFNDFIASHAEVRAFLTANGDLDLGRIRFPNPFVPGIRFSLATGLHVITAHERRHLWQAWRVRRALEE